MTQGNILKRDSEALVLEIIKQIGLAIAFEKQHQYINAIGNSGDFTSFIRRKSQEALKYFKANNKWQSIYNLMDRYPYLDLTTRMHICKKILETLNDLKQQHEETIPPASVPSPQINLDANLDIGSLDVQFIKSVGPVLGAKLKTLGITTCEKLLTYFPRKHISYSDATPISDLIIDQNVTVIGFVHKVTAFTSPKKGLVILTILIKDNSGTVKINKYFQGNSAQFYLKQYKSQFPSGTYVLVVGTVKPDKYTKNKTIHNAELEIISEDFAEQDRSAHTAKIVPIYPLAEGVSLKSLRKLIHQTLNLYGSHIKEFIPEQILKINDLADYKNAISWIHFPGSIEEKDKALHRLIFNEFFLMQLRFMQVRHQHKKKNQGIKFNCFQDGLVDKFIASLPFKLTHAQERVFYNEILPDMVSSEPMHRLLQGDVGSGKTVIAFLALLVAIADGYQGVVMVPTEILAEQHYKKFQEWISKMEESLQIKVALLLGKQKTKEKKEILQALENGSINLVVGTHALIQEGVKFNKLGLIVIDEQHRFGVKQRELLALKALQQAEDRQLGFGDLKEESIDKALGVSVEKLFMTATPIPRTLALAMHGDLDMSEIDEMPVGRLPIITSIIKRKIEAYQIINQEIAKGNQAYIVFPLIDESETLSAKAATVEYEKLKAGVFENYRLGLIHGKLKDQEKEEIMRSFRNKEIDILVSTTVIEVGVDVPDATVILIESSERFGLAQLHQLRGRVGRSNKQSYCLLSSGSKGENTQIRLNILAQTNNGFIVAQEDLKLRGAGDLVGLKQAGMPESVLQGLINQEEILHRARAAAKDLITNNPELGNLPLLRRKLEQSFYTLNINAG